MPIASSYITYYAIQTDGTLIGWGENLRGLINYPDSLPSYEGAVVMMEDVAAVYAGDWVTLILCSDGTLWGWAPGCSVFCLKGRLRRMRMTLSF